MKEDMLYNLPEVRVKLAEGIALYSTRPMDSPQTAVRCMADMLAEMDREYLCVVNLDNALHPINYNIVSIGGTDLAPVSVGNVFKTAILSNANGIILLHNHPSGSLTPSRADIDVTKKIYGASRLMDIELIDHIIVGGGSGDYCSMQESGLLRPVKDSCKFAEGDTVYRKKTTAFGIAPDSRNGIKASNTISNAKEGLIFNERKAARKHHRSR